MEKRNKKRLITLTTLMILSGIGIAGTTYYAYNQSQTVVAQMGTPPSSQEQGTPPNLSNGSGNTNQPPEKPDGESSGQMPGTPPAKPGESDSANATSPAKPGNSTSDGNTDSQETNTSDSSASASSSQEGTSNTPGTPPDGQKASASPASLNNVEKAVITGCALIFSASGIYLVLSGGCQTPLRKKSKRVIYLCATAALTTALTFGSIAVANKLTGVPRTVQAMDGSQSSALVTATGAKTVDGTEVSEKDQTYTSTQADENAILVTSGGSLTIDGANINKESGDSSNTENSEFYGINAGVLVQKDSTAVIKNATITTSAKGANAVFATGENAKITISDSTITTTGESSSRGLDATYGGTIEADNVTITTQGGSCAALATDRGEGTVTVNNSTLETNGAGSPIIYSTGAIAITDTTGTANGSQCVVIEGKNSATVTDSTIVSSGKGNRNDVDQCGVMIYQSMSGDAAEGEGTFTAVNSTLSIDSSSAYYQTAPMFFITNTDAVINLTNTKLNFGSGTLISAKGTDEWGTSSSNGGHVTVNATNQTLTGDVTADQISTVTLNLKKTTLKGTINADQSAKSVTVSLDADSCWDVTGDSYVTILTLENNDLSLIKSNGHTIYYSASENSWLNGQTVTLSDGGKLVALD